MNLEIHQFACLSDNYGYLIRCRDTGDCASIDSPDATVILEHAEAKGWTINQVWNTHHHFDHIGGNDVLRNHGARVIAPLSEAQYINPIDHPVKPDDTVQLGSLTAKIIDVGGHTNGHIAYWFENENIIFVGDSLFALGCGRMFEGTPQQFLASLERIRALDPRTIIYCAHEYTQTNLKFALSIDPDNCDLHHYAETVYKKRKLDQPTIPFRLENELKTNPFLRWDDPNLRQKLGLSAAQNHEVFAEIRRRKDIF